MAPYFLNYRIPFTGVKCISEKSGYSVDTINCSLAYELTREEGEETADFPDLNASCFIHLL